MSSQRLLVCDTFDPIFRWLQDVNIPRNLVGLDFPQPAQCAYADDLAVAASFIFSGLTNRVGAGISICGPHCWAQFELSEMLLDAIW